MPGLVPGIHVLVPRVKKVVDGRDIGERSDAVLRTAMPGHDDVDRSSPAPIDIACDDQASSTSALTSHANPMAGMVTVAFAGSFSVPLRRPSARASRTALSISR